MITNWADIGARKNRVRSIEMQLVWIIPGTIIIGPFSAFVVNLVVEQ